jgi:hypothetical protein
MTRDQKSEKPRCIDCGATLPVVLGEMMEAYCYCDEDGGPWCGSCFERTACGRGNHGEGCATMVFDEDN